MKCFKVFLFFITCCLFITAFNVSLKAEERKLYISSLAGANLVESNTFTAVNRQYVPVQHTEKGINDKKAQEILNKTRSNLEKMGVVELDFTYSHAKENSKGVENKGEMIFDGNKYIIRLDEIDVFCDAEDVYTYLKDLEEVSISKCDTEENYLNPLSFIKNYDKNYRAKYIRAENISGKMCHIIDLIPLEANKFHKIRLYINTFDTRIYAIYVYDKSSYVYSYIINSIQSIKMNKSSFTFNFKTHPNVLINDMR